MRVETEEAARETMTVSAKDGVQKRNASPPSGCQHGSADGSVIVTARLRLLDGSALHVRCASPSLALCQRDMLPCGLPALQILHARPEQ